MMPLTADTPKPLLRVGNHSLLEHHLLRLRDQGFRHFVINLAYHGEQIRAAVGNGSRYGINISYADEAATGALETAGGIINALPLINSDPFIVVNGDIYTDFPCAMLLKPLHRLARLVLVDNPPQHPNGDFGLEPTSGCLSISQPAYTFSGIALYKKQFFAGLEPGARPLAPLILEHIANSQLEGLIYNGVWHDIGTPERLTALDRRLRPRTCGQ